MGWLFFVLVVLGAVLLLTGVFADDEPQAAPQAAGTVSCSYAPDDSGNPNLTDVGTPPDADSTPATGTTTLLMTTGQGELTLTLDREKAPCAAASFTYLAEQGFFDGSPCHRMVNGESFGVLQCGDPSGTGQGGPTYKYAEEVTPESLKARLGWPAMPIRETRRPGSTSSIALAGSCGPLDASMAAWKRRSGIVSSVHTCSNPSDRAYDRDRSLRPTRWIDDG